MEDLVEDLVEEKGWFCWKRIWEGKENRKSLEWAICVYEQIVGADNRV